MSIEIKKDEKEQEILPCCACHNVSKVSYCVRTVAFATSMKNYCSKCLEELKEKITLVLKGE